MFRVIRFDLLLKVMVFLTIAITIAIYAIVQSIVGAEIGIFKLVTISLICSSVLMFMLLFQPVSRKVWAIVRFFNKKLYPDLNGVWVGQVTTGDNDVFEVRAVIRQALLFTEIDMHGETVKSITLETTPTTELNQKKLYYVYRSTPKDPAWADYTGSTIFDVIENGSSITLSGKYYTDRKSVGRISIKRVSTDSDADVSYY